MPHTILYPLLLLLFSCDCMSEVPQQENEVQAEGSEHLNVEERGAPLTSGEFQQYFLTGIHSELAELRSTDGQTAGHCGRTGAAHEKR